MMTDDMRTHIRSLRKQSVADAFSAPLPIRLESNGYIFRALGNRLYYRKQHTTYVDFLLELIKSAFGKNWHSDQVKTPHEDRHIVMKWMKSWQEHCVAQRPHDAPPDTVFCSEPTGDGQALLTLADDLYRLQVAKSLTSRLMKRLRDPSAFQGARYEIQIASIFLRSGFDIEWTEGNSVRRCEFYAVHRHSRVRVAVEAKSRKRPGVLGEGGTFYLDHLFGFAKLLEDARQQNPGDCPFCIFIDVNWPLVPAAPKWEKPWMAEVFRLWQQSPTSSSSPDPVAMTAFTNFSWHYQGKGRAMPQENLISYPRYAALPLGDSLTRQALNNSIFTYGSKIEESPTPMIDDSVIDQLVDL